MLPFPQPQVILDKSMMITDQQLLELNPPLPGKDSYLPFSLQPTIFPLEGLHDLLNILPTATGSTGVLQDPQVNFPPSAEVRKNVNSKIRSGKRTGRTDRHSKICTAAGVRDRRMRLSLDVARKFFDLQDMLGFDKGSETVQWLLTNSRAAIKELTAASASNPCSFSNGNLINGESHLSPICEVASPSVSDVKGKSSTFEICTDAEKNKSKNKSSANKEPQDMAAFKSLLAKESRAQARARARERTREKKIRMCFLSTSTRFGFAEDMQDLKSLCFLDQDLSSKSHCSTKLTSENQCCDIQINASGSSTWLHLINSATITQQASTMQLACFRNNWA